VWIPVTGSKETIEWAARQNLPITPGLGHRGLREDVTRYYAQQLEQNGFRLTPDHLIVQANVYLADSKEQAINEAGPYTLYFNQTLFSHGNITETNLQAQQGYVNLASFDYVRPENQAAVSGDRERYRGLTMEGVRRLAEDIPWGTPEEARQRLIAEADHAGASTIVVNMNRGAMPQEMFREQIRRFAREVLPALQAHEVGAVRVA
jgi:alkanesulfonate monooxygenase SsuD/methylene tetrahydromethanopterin reductase-like flavin-dependent oxidoreductase (luciferase family)